MSSSSSSAIASAANPSSPSTAGTANYFTNLGLGYPIAIALGFLVLVSILLLASYICCRASRSSSPSSIPSHHHHPNPNHDGIIVPRIIFVAEDDDGDGNADGRRDLDDSAVVGLDQAVINSYPKFPYERDGAAIKESTCSICLCEYKASEMLRMMPECRHCFHLCCLDAWLKLNGSCPVCRNSPLPTPLSTPLQEVVPLAQFPADRRRSR